MNNKLPFKQVDVFSTSSCKGNPVCVFLNNNGLSADRMQEIARWTNLSETTFISPSKNADYRVRIFTPEEELPFAGHPTIGTAHAFLEANPISKLQIIQECDYGLIEINIIDNEISFTLPKYTIGTSVETSLIEESLGINISSDAQLIDTGPHWVIANINSASELANININHQSLFALFSQYRATGITLYAAENGQAFVRTFFGANGVVVEDPVCGSGNAAVAAHIKATNRLAITGSSYQSYQGQYVGRDGKVSVRIDDRISIGGQCQTVFDGVALV